MSKEMGRQQENNDQKKVFGLIERYAHGFIGRREFLKGVGKFALSGVAAVAVTNVLNPNYARGQIVAPNDSRLQTQYVDIPSPQGHGTIRGYLVRPANASGRLPGIVTIHGAGGLNPHHEDIARRLALENFVALAPDGATSLRANPRGEDTPQQSFRSLDAGKVDQDFVAAVRFMKTHPFTNGRVGAMGFCWGGGMVNRLATLVPDLNAGAPYYGRPPELADVPNIQAPLMLHYGGLDERVNATWPPYEEALKAAGKKYTRYVYEGAEHSFNSETNTGYNKGAAELSWMRTISFMNEHLRQS